MSRFALLLLTLCLLACTALPSVTPAADAAQLAVAVGGASSTSGSGRPEPVVLWQDASIFRLVSQLIGSARSRVMVEMYELGRKDITAMLGAARARGVAVRVITDPTVKASRRAAVVLDTLGVPERVYPVDDVRHQIDHVKLLIADGEAAVGGMNWGAHSDRNHDYVLETRAQGEVARLVRIFDQDWELAAGHPVPLAVAASQVAQTAPGEEIRAMLEGALAQARARVLAEVYTLTDPEVIAGLAAAHRRGALVRVLLDPNQPYNRRAYTLLSSSGVEVRWYPIPKGALLHAKIGLFDGVLVLGSANWTLSGLGVNHELDIETQDPTALAAYTSRFSSDWARSAGG
ncbi:MAG TPA: phosphatidylserine/phosphatidylglycerophosphate/cardiolipin synthase family protein [Candidatus Dormibacteraeota bacterium]|nr:phosphatidylserine/phosphatidylglycerophosphate/cardiolipin synthase family protein [Candidatus Dormibacteraeota bacterium]